MFIDKSTLQAKKVKNYKGLIRYLRKILSGEVRYMFLEEESMPNIISTEKIEIVWLEKYPIRCVRYIKKDSLLVGKELFRSELNEESLLRFFGQRTIVLRLINKIIKKDKAERRLKELDFKFSDSKAKEIEEIMNSL